ncbi:hypothetical protein ACFVHB_00315 [Kitasatospora sp. NPDC127111]|uniref:hypothetical protein n=1 Tax=Kitasatospora sp. NPDC127111 TaxID=3345363 RepID=UPI003643C38E
MRVKVSFRYNAATGLVEEFRVDDLDQTGEEDHDELHEDIALRLGQLLDRVPVIHEILPEQDAAAIPQETGGEQPEEITVVRPERRVL